MFNIKDFLEKMTNYQEGGFEEKKYSFLIVKPNGVRHLETYVKALKENGFNIIEFFAIKDFASINVELHNSKKKLRHIIPINSMFKTFFGNYGILILISKAHITFEDFVKEVCDFKVDIRKQFIRTDLAYVFDISSLIGDQQNQVIKIFDENGNEVPKREMNQKGTFKVYSVNSLHSPDPTVDATITEMKILNKMGIFDSRNIISRRIIRKMIKYETFAFIKDMWESKTKGEILPLVFFVHKQFTKQLLELHINVCIIITV